MTGPPGLRVLAAGSLRPAFDVLAAAVPAAVVVDYANARDLAGRIVAGERADVFASASDEHPRQLHRAGLVDEPRPFASNRLVIAVPAASEASDSSVLAAPRTRVVIEVAGIPLGDYTREFLGVLDRAQPGFAGRVLANVIAEEQTVDAVAARLREGEADAAVLYATDVAARRGQLRAIQPPPGVDIAVTCVACVVRSTAQPERALGWIDALLAPAGVELLAQAGFGAPRT